MQITNSKIKYNQQVNPELSKKPSYGNRLAVPRIEKLIVNTGTGKLLKETDKVEEIAKAMAEITGQKPLRTKSRKAISGFKIREGLEIGIKVTLRGKRMWDFIDRLIHAALPRTRDFQGISEKSIDENGNLNIGIKEHIIFPEIVPEKVKNIFGLQITIVTTAKNRQDAKELFAALGFPIK